MTDQREPNQLQGNAAWLQGKGTELVGSVIGSQEWKEAGQQQAKAGAEEVETARAIAYGEAQKDNLSGKVQSAYGMIIGDKEQQDAGNLKAQEAEVKRAVNAPEGATSEMPNDAGLTLERLKGKLESAQGMLVGDQAKQTDGNIRDATAELKDGVAKATGGDPKAT